jgi:hypothetical protein
MYKFYNILYETLEPTDLGMGRGLELILHGYQGQLQMCCAYMHTQQLSPSYHC